MDDTFVCLTVVTVTIPVLLTAVITGIDIVVVTVFAVTTIIP
jgi:hypothetical protein